MEYITKVEVSWIVAALEKTAHLYREFEEASSYPLERSMAHLRSEQLSGISDRLDRAVKRGDKRIEITY